MRYILFVFVLLTKGLCAQELSKENKNTLISLEKSIKYLADDKLEGRRTGSAGEKLAYEFIEAQFKKAGLKAAPTFKTFIQEFEVKDGRVIGKETSCTINGKLLTIDTDYFPLSFSGNASKLAVSSNSEMVTYFDTKTARDENKTNPHFDLKDVIYADAKKAESEKKSLFVVYNSSSEKDDISYEAKEKNESLSIPVIYITDRTKPTGVITTTISISEKQRYGHNVIGYIDNKAASTIILGAHYDHLGYGEDHNSLYVGATPMIHNGADDNASGVGALIELAEWIKNSSLKKYNYTFIAFSGEELGLYGSKYFSEHSPFDLATVNYMLNMDMVGRLNDSTHVLSVGGYGTSPSWGEIIKKEDGLLKIKTDSSGTGPSDHTSFYKKNIPVLYFFTGSHSDYHKPTDDADKINFSGELAVINYIKTVLSQTDKKEKLIFSKTREVATSRSKFKVTLGIMPDYTYDGNGVRVDAVIDGRVAQKAGILTGDVIYKLGEHSFHDVETYMQVLNKFDKGTATKVKLKRGNEDIELNIVF